MSVVHVLDSVTDWVRENVCPKIQLKQPPKDMDAATDEGYEHTLVTPAAFCMYLPTTDNLPPNIRSPFPSVCVRFMTGQDELTKNSGFVDVELCFSTWNPGEHGEDILRPDGSGGFKQWSGAEADAYFRRCSDGWRDAWNFVDIARREIESVTAVGGYAIDRATPVKYGPLTEQESVADFYPYWFAWVSFRVQYPVVRNIEELQEIL